MKGHTEILQIVIVMVFMMIGTSFILTLILKTSNSEMDYLNDKSMYEIHSFRYDNKGNLLNYLNVSLSEAQAVCLPIVQDEYCPYADKIYYVPEGYNQSVYAKGNINLDSKSKANISHTVARGAGGWNSYRMKQMDTNLGSGWATTLTKSDYADKFGHLVYDAAKDAWIITPSNITETGVKK